MAGLLPPPPQRQPAAHHWKWAIKAFPQQHYKMPSLRILSFVAGGGESPFPTPFKSSGGKVLSGFLEGRAPLPPVVAFCLALSLQKGFGGTVVGSPQHASLSPSVAD